MTQQLAMFATYSVHCFFDWCEHVVCETDPYAAHEVMEAHYRAAHAAACARMVAQVV